MARKMSAEQKAWAMACHPSAGKDIIQTIERGSVFEQVEREYMSRKSAVYFTIGGERESAADPAAPPQVGTGVVIGRKAVVTDRGEILQLEGSGSPVAELQALELAWRDGQKWRRTRAFWRAMGKPWRVVRESWARWTGENV